MTLPFPSLNTIREMANRGLHQLPATPISNGIICKEGAPGMGSSSSLVMSGSERSRVQGYSLLVLFLNMRVELKLTN